MSANRLFLGIVATGLISLLAGCGGEVSIGEREVSKTELEKSVFEALEAKGPEFVDGIKLSCPKDIEAKIGETTTCELEHSPSSEVYDVVITMTDDEGGFDLEVADEPKVAAAR